MACHPFVLFSSGISRGLYTIGYNPVHSSENTSREARKIWMFSRVSRIKNNCCDNKLYFTKIESTLSDGWMQT
jgi:hypothetical protein